jgi:hypothetical protein
VSDLAELQADFLRFLATGEDGMARWVTAQGGASVHARLGIYRNAYRLRLREAIDTDHEMLGRYLGDELFDQMVQGFIRSHPSHYYSLRDFTARLPAFLSEASPFADHPILSEIAAFERLLLDVFDARDLPRLALADLRAVPPERWPGLRIRFHPSLQLFAARWNSVESWRALKEGGTPPVPERRENEAYWLLWRGRDRLSHFRPLARAEHAMLMVGLHGEPLSTLCERAGEWMADAEVSAQVLESLNDWIEQGLIVRFDG